MPNKVELFFISGFGFDCNSFDFFENRLGGFFNIKKFNYTKLLKEIEIDDFLNQFYKTKSKKIIIAWSLGAMLLVMQAIKKNIRFDGAIFLNMSPRLLEDSSYTGYKDSTFCQMLSSVKKDRVEFLHKFFSNVVEKQKINYFISKANVFSDEDLLFGLEKLRSIDIRNEIPLLKNLLRTNDSSKILFLYGKNDLVVPISHAIYIKNLCKKTGFRCTLDCLGLIITI